MKNSIFCAALGLLFFSFGCKKQTDPGYRVTIGGLETGSSEWDYWLILHNDGGEVLQVERFFPATLAGEFSVETEDLDVDGRFNVTLAIQNRVTKKLGLRTYWAIPSGKKLPVAGYISELPYHRNIERSVDLTITDAPEIERLRAVGASPNSFFVMTPAPDFRALFSAWTGNAGLLLDLELKNHPQHRYCWRSLTDVQGTQLIIPYTLFSSDVPTTTIALPTAARWSYAVRAVTNDNEAIHPVWGLLANSVADDDSAATSAFSFVQPDIPSLKNLWVAIDEYNGQLGFEQTLTPGTPIAYPEMDFSVVEFDYSNSNQLRFEFEGEFPALGFRIYGDGGKTAWSGEGAPDKLENARMPDFPDSLRQNWPNLNAFTVGYTVGATFRELDHYEELLDRDVAQVVASSYWRAKLGYGIRRQYWP